MVGYTKAAGTDEKAQATKSEKVIRNLKNTIFSQFNVTNKVNGESDIRSGAVDVRNMKVYKPAPTEVTIGVTDDISKVSIPASELTVKMPVAGFNVMPVGKFSCKLSVSSEL